MVAGIMAVNLIIYLGVESGYEAGLGDVFGHSVVLGIVAISVLVSGPVLGVTYLGRRGRHRDRAAVDAGMGVRAMFENRVEAGVALGRRLAHPKKLDPIVLGLPRGGVPVAAEVAKALRAPLDVLVVRKLGVPHKPEFAMGAIAEGGVRHIDWNVVANAGVSGSQVTEVVGRETEEFTPPCRSIAGRSSSSRDLW